MTTERRELVERIWARDPTVWTAKDEARWLGWLDEPARRRDDIDLLLTLADAVQGQVDDVVLLGMGGSSLAPEVLRRAFRGERMHVLDTTHPRAIRALADGLNLRRTLFVASSKSGTTLETRSHADYFWRRAPRGEQWVAITDPGSALEELARKRGFRAIFPGEPTIGGRYSALSPFGLVPAALLEVDLERLLERALEMVEACHFDEGNPGLELGLALGEGWQEGRDKVCLPNPSGFGLWAEQLLAESTGKNGKGLIPAPDEPGEQAAKDKTSQILASGKDPRVEPTGSVAELCGDAREGDYFAILAFVEQSDASERALAELAERVRRETGCVVTHGFGPRYLHSTGQLHKGGPNTGLFLQVVEDYGDELKIPDRPFGFAWLIRAQAAGDFESLRERGRRVARVHRENLV